MTDYQRLVARLGEIQDIRHAIALLDWDQQVNIPRQGNSARAQQLATLETIAHEKFTADELGDMLSGLNPDNYEPDSDEACLIRTVREDYEREKKLPSSLVAKITKLTSRASAVWQDARQANDFSRFQPVLEQIIELMREKAELLGYEEHIYDALLDLYEPKMRSSRVQQLFTELGERLALFVEELNKRQDRINDGFFKQAFPVDRQRDFGMVPLRDIGYDFNAGRQDKSAHPFTTNFSIRDVRITTRFHADDVKSALFSTLHEGGHGMYEQNIDLSLERTPLAEGTSLGFHESQSRLWENLVGRSREFWSYYFPIMRGFFMEQMQDVSEDQFYRAINRVEPSLIRVEADEVTYNLHIFLRFDLERKLITGDLAVKDLPEAWNSGMEHFLGIRPANDAEGVLQDVHWSAGLFGYFPTYALGNLFSVQIFNQVQKEIPDLREQMQRGEFAPLRNWLTKKIYRHGRKFSSSELIERITGGPLAAEPFMEYVEKKYRDVYGF